MGRWGGERERDRETEREREREKEKERYKEINEQTRRKEGRKTEIEGRKTHIPVETKPVAGDKCTHSQ